MKVKKHLPEIMTVLLAIFVVIISLTPVVIPENTFKPQLLGLPYSLWMGMLVTILLVFLTYVATRVHYEARKAKAMEEELKNDNK